MTHRTCIASLATCILVTLLAAPVLAHDGVEHETDAEAAAHANASIEFPVRPLDMIKARAQQIKKDAMNARIDLRADAHVEMEGASSSSERKGIIRNFVGDRLDTVKSRVASTSAMRRDIRGAIRWHGGLIRERFTVAIRQFDRIVARIESRIEKLEAEGVATASAEAELSLAVTAIATAKTDVQAVADFVASVEEAEDRATVKAELQAKIRTAHTSIKAAHQALQKTVRVLKALKPAAAVNATTSVQITTE